MAMPPVIKLNLLSVIATYCNIRGAVPTLRSMTLVIQALCTADSHSIYCISLRLTYPKLNKFLLKILLLKMNFQFYQEVHLMCRGLKFLDVRAFGKIMSMSMPTVL